MSETGTWTLGIRLLIKLLMPTPRLASRLHPGPGRWILDALEVNNSLRRMTKISRTLKGISLSKILLLMHHQMVPNPLRHSPKRTRTVVLAKEDLDDKATARILLPLASTSPLSGKTRTKIRTRKTLLTLSATLISRKAIIPTSALRRSQKTSVGLDELYVGNWE